jgi:hypothetical protein
MCCFSDICTKLACRLSSIRISSQLTYYWMTSLILIYQIVGLLISFQTMSSRWSESFSERNMILCIIISVLIQCQLQESDDNSGYRAPEVTMSGQYSEKSDVYSFGVVMLELLTGRKAFDRWTYRYLCYSCTLCYICAIIWQNILLYELVRCMKTNILGTRTDSRLVLHIKNWLLLLFEPFAAPCNGHSSH